MASVQKNNLTRGTYAKMGALFAAAAGLHSAVFIPLAKAEMNPLIEEAVKEHAARPHLGGASLKEVEAVHMEVVEARADSNQRDAEIMSLLQQLISRK